MTHRIIASALWCVFILGAATVAEPQAVLRSISVGVTSKTANDWTTYIADRYGLFAANGIRPDIAVVGVNSGVAQQLTGTAFDIGEVTTTQMVLAVQGGAPLVSIQNSGSGVPYSLIAKKGITSVAQLKGKLISIGGPSDITRPFMDTIMEHAGFKPDDWTYTFAGSSSDRYAALVAGAIDATLLAPPMSFKAIAQGFPVLDEVPKYFPNFPYVTWAVRPAWAKDHADLVVRFIKSQLQAARWLEDPANKQKAIALLMDETNASLDDATKSYAVFVTQEHYFSTTGTFGPESFARVLQTMIKAGMLPPPAPPPTKFYDNSYAERADAQLSGR
jgi:NitT/TauT family transport system substrate-binding protein